MADAPGSAMGDRGRPPLKAEPRKQLSMVLPPMLLDAIKPKAITGERLVHQPDAWFSVDFQADQGSPGREAQDESAGAVDRVDHPAIRGISLLEYTHIATCQNKK